MKKFPVFETIKNSFVFIFENPGHALRMTWPYALILIIMEAMVEVFPVLDYQGINAEFIISCVFLITIISGLFYAIALPSLAWQRAYLSGIAPDNQPHPFRPTREEWRFIGGHTLASIFLPGAIYGVFICVALGLIPFFAGVEHLIDVFILLCIALPIASIMFALTALCTRFLIYLPAIAGGQPLSLKESFRITKGNALRLTITAIITVILFTLTSIALNAKPMIEDLERAYEYGYLNEKLENERERQQTAGSPVIATDELSNKGDFSDSPPTLIDFLFYIPANVILNLFSVLVAAGILAQFCKWTMENVDDVVPIHTMDE
jgi:hypothetical protein